MDKLSFDDDVDVKSESRDKLRPFAAAVEGLPIVVRFDVDLDDAEPRR